MRLDDPEPAAVVESHGDGLDDVGFAGEQRGTEAFGQLDALGGALRREWDFLSEDKRNDCQDEERGKNDAPHEGGTPWVVGKPQKELERRLADSIARPDAVTPWEEIKTRVLAEGAIVNLAVVTAHWRDLSPAGSVPVA